MIWIVLLVLPLLFIANMFLIMPSSANDPVFRNDSIFWNAQIKVSDISRAADFVVMGEATNANDGPPADILDAPKSPMPPTPYVFAYFDDGLAYPYNKLTSDYRHYCDGVEKQWNLSLFWDLLSYPATIDFTWSSSDFIPSPYGSVYLRDSAGSILADMLAVEIYSFSVSSMGSQNFLITCENASCPIEGENCYNPYLVTIDQDLDYMVNHTTIGYKNDYFNTSMGTFDDGEDTIYKINVTTNASVDITLSSAASGIAVGMFDDCPNSGILLAEANDTGQTGSAIVSNFSFTLGEYYLMIDGNGTSFDYNLSILSTQNDPPIAVNDTASCVEDGSVVVNVSSNDVDVDGLLLLDSVVVVDGPFHGGVVVFDNGSVEYTPDDDFFGFDWFKYTILDDDGAVSNVAMVNVTVVSVNDAPVAGFVFEPVSPVTGEIVYFNSTSVDVDGSIVNWTWDFGDGSVGFGEQVTYQYGSEGDYSVELMVVDDEGGVGSVVQVVSVGNQLPVAGFVFEPVDPVSGELVFFNSTSYDPDGSIVNWSWSFGDGSVGFGEQVTHVYQDSGAYDVTLVVTDNQLATNQTSRLIIILSPNHRPTVEIQHPEEGDVVTDFLVISGIASDEDGDSDIEHVQIRFDSNNTWYYAVGKAVWSYYWDTNAYAEGEHTIYARSFDGKEYSLLDKVNVTIIHNNPPYKPKNPQPSDNATGTDVNLTLNWDGGDPDDDQVTYTLYFGTSTSPPLLKKNIDHSYFITFYFDLVHIFQDLLFVVIF